MQQGLEGGFLSLDGFREEGERGRRFGSWGQNRRELNSIVELLLWDLDFRPIDLRHSFSFSAFLLSGSQLRGWFVVVARVYTRRLDFFRYPVWPRGDLSCRG